MGRTGPAIGLGGGVRRLPRGRGLDERLEAVPVRQSRSRRPAHGFGADGLERARSTLRSRRPGPPGRRSASSTVATSSDDAGLSARPVRRCRRLGASRLRAPQSAASTIASLGAIGRSVAGSGRIALGDGLEQQDRARRRRRSASRSTPRIGIRTTRSQRRRTAGARPWPSLPTTIASGPRRSASSGGQRRVGLGARRSGRPGCGGRSGRRQVVDRGEQQVLDRARPRP